MRARTRTHPLPPLVRLLPNMLTLLALCAGLTAIPLAMQGDFAGAVGLILFAAILDGLDGRLARRLGSESAIGAELDSLCDFVNFGVAPALVLHLWAFGTMSPWGWASALIYAVACGLRLARFNIRSREQVATAKKSFTGVPSPAGAMLALLPIYLGQLLPEGAALLAPPAAVWMLLVAALMISRLPTPAFRATGVTRQAHQGMILVGLVVIAAALVVHPWLTLVLLDVGYLLLLVLGWSRLRRRFARKDE